jgi:hypothetical protein
MNLGREVVDGAGELGVGNQFLIRRVEVVICLGLLEPSVLTPL